MQAAKSASRPAWPQQLVTEFDASLVRTLSSFVMFDQPALTTAPLSTTYEHFVARGKPTWDHTAVVVDVKRLPGASWQLVLQLIQQS